MEKKKKFRLFDAVLMAVVVVLVVESVAPAAAIGPSQFFWWGLLLLFFFLPYGLISAELGTSYDEGGGIYDWVNRAFGHKWGGRAAYLYWINFPIWMASLAVLFVEVINQIFQVQLGTWPSVLIELAFTWIVTLICCFPVADSKWILNLAAFAKIFIILSLGGLGIYVATTKGMATTLTPNNMLPSFDAHSLSYISVILFNFLGFEVVTTMASDMPNPKKQIPEAIVLGGILIAVFYVFAAFGMGAAIPTNQLSASGGLMDSILLLVGQHNWFVVLVGILFAYSLVANLISWSAGVNEGAEYAAKNHDLPSVFSITSKKTGMPTGATILNGIIASVLIVAAPFIPNQNIFWAFFSLNVVALLGAYLLMFPAFFQLRRKDPDHERPFKVPGGPVVIALMAFIPVILLLIGVYCSIIPLNGSAAEFNTKIPVLIGTIIAVVIGEICIYFAQLNGRKKDQQSDQSKSDDKNHEGGVPL
ncbi:APC family permease [Levilactobacillus bambusae]|uniref:Amino acid:proton antiporter n=1 Tax=Levilactobacillus bambusae TaxID=2024736 RepID=A0A2V1N0E4_9LACO|nr:APC family permease [Levilactobacillus bambusae]PWF99845.1 amino acid:proton antiporter [Levilactobacillus bambusae]